MSYLPALGGKPIVSTRHGVIHHSISGHFAYRQGKWKLALARASGGWSSPKENQAPAGASKGQLYDMAVDPGETTNLYESRPEIVKRLLGQLKSDIERGRSTDGQLSRRLDGLEDGVRNACEIGIALLECCLDLIHQLRANRSGTDRKHLHTGVGQIDGQRVGQSEQRCLRTRVGGRVGHRDHAEMTGDIDDSAGAALEHGG